MSFPIRVVLADDTEEIRKLLRLAFSTDERFEVVGEAGDGAAAIEVVAEMKPDVIVLDLAMPVMDGLQAIPEIVKTSEQTKIVVLSAFEAAQMSAEAIARGAHAYLEKGTGYMELMTVLADLCSNGKTSEESG